MNIVWKVYIPVGIDPKEVMVALSNLVHHETIFGYGSLIEIEIVLPENDYKESFYTFANYIAKAIEVTFHAKVKQYTRNGEQLIAI